MILSNAEVARIAAEVAREMLPALQEQFREEVRAEVARQVAEVARQQAAPRRLRLPEVIALTGYQKSKIWALTKAGLFPQPEKRGLRNTAWREHEVVAWLERQAA